jgi:hypothetical protein
VWGRGEVSMCKYLPHINSLWFYTHTGHNGVWTEHSVVAVWDWRGFRRCLASGRASDVPRVTTLSPHSGAPNGSFPHPARAWGMCATWPQTGQNKGSPVARSETAMWEFPTSAKCSWGLPVPWICLLDNNNSYNVWMTSSAAQWIQETNVLE